MGQLRTRWTASQVLTADKYKPLHNFLSRFLSTPEICTLPCSCLRAAKSKNGRKSKIRAKKFFNVPAQNSINIFCTFIPLEDEGA